MTENPVEKIRKTLRFRAWHRGTKEMDLLLGSFADQHLQSMSAEELGIFKEMLELGDPELYSWYLGKSSVPANLDNDIMRSFLKHRLA